MSNVSSIAFSASLVAISSTLSYYYAQSQHDESLHDTLAKNRPPSPKRGREIEQLRGDTPELFDIDYDMHKEHRDKVVKEMRKLNMSGVIVLDGGEELSKYDTDTSHAFRQESFFQYLFGVREPDVRGCIDIGTGKSMLFVPRLSDEWELWCGTRPTLEEIARHYKVDEVHYEDETSKVLLEKKVKFLHRLRGVNLDSGLETTTIAEFKGIDKFTLDDTTLHKVLVECRVIKSERELELLRFVNKLSSKAHIQVMKTITPTMYEFQAESTFLHYCYFKGGARLHAYTCICGSGNNASTLHYGHAGAPNDKQLNDGDMFLLDMGAELHGYASDITCSFPVNGRFTEDQIMLYEGVLKSHDAVLNAAKDGVEWIDMHLLSHRALTEHLLEHGMFKGGNVDELMENQVSAYFYPHGLGHLMGLDVHDVGGYLPGVEKSTKKVLSKLRCGRQLKANMVVTIEPGCYFIHAQLNEAMSTPSVAKFINWEMVDRFRGTGGVRIESDIIIHKNNAENMTQVPRLVSEVETVMNGGVWKPSC